MEPDPTTMAARSASSVGNGPERRSTIASQPAVVLVWDDTGACTSVRMGVSGDARELPRLGGEGWLHLVHPDDRQRATALLDSVLTATTSAEAPVRLRDGDAWALLRLHRRPDGGAEGVLVDATGSLATATRLTRLLERLNQLRSEDDIVRAVVAEGVTILGGTTCGVHLLEEETGDLVMVGSIGLPRDTMVEEFGRIPSDVALPATDALRTGQPVVIRSPDECRERYPALSESRVPIAPAFVVVPMYSASGEPFGVFAVGFAQEAALAELDQRFIVQVAGQCAMAMHRARLTTAAEQNQGQLAFLDALSGALSRSLDVEAALTSLAEIAVPRLADWCAVRVLESSSKPEPLVGAAHRDPTKIDLLRELAGWRLPRNLVSPAPLGEAIRIAQPFIRENADPESLAHDVGDPGLVDIIATVGANAVVVFPLHARGRLIGTLSLGNAPGRVLRQDEFDLARAAASRAAVLVDNARLFAERSQVAEALEDSLLPGVLPRIPGVDLGARYRPAGQDLDVGGDFYDAFEAGTDCWVFAVGDVCGHGVEAASLTGMARHTLRSSAVSSVPEAGPSVMLGHLNKLLLQHLTEMSARRAAGSGEDEALETLRFCTVLLGTVRPVEEGVDIVLCSAGHPLPMVHRRDDVVETVGVPGTLLGVVDDVTLTDVTINLAPGETLVAYTDGVTDRRRERRRFDDEGVMAVMREGRSLSAKALAQRLESAAMAFGDDEPSDDMAVFVLKTRSSDG
jgi:serine phosphatase RsbU (regulator of sigma subunit)